MHVLLRILLKKVCDYDSCAHDVIGFINLPSEQEPGYRFLFQVPPKSLFLSRMMKSRVPTRRIKSIATHIPGENISVSWVLYRCLARDYNT